LSKRRSISSRWTTFVPHVRDIISVGEFYELAAGGKIIFT
jgi:hypothetical protein